MPRKVGLYPSRLAKCAATWALRTASSWASLAAAATACGVEASTVAPVTDFNRSATTLALTPALYSPDAPEKCSPRAAPVVSSTTTDPDDPARVVQS